MTYFRRSSLFWVYSLTSVFKVFACITVLILVSLLFPGKAQASCAIDIPLDCGGKASTNTAWTNRSPSERQTLLNSSEVQDNYKACYSFGQILYTECSAQMPATLVFLKTFSGDTEPTQVTTILAEGNDKLATSTSLSQLFKNYFSGQLLNQSMSMASTAQKNKMSQAQIDAIKNFSNPNASSSTLSLSVACNLNDKSSFNEIAKMYLENKGCSFSFECLPIKEGAGVGEIIRIKKLNTKNSSLFCSQENAQNLIFTIVSNLNGRANLVQGNQLYTSKNIGFSAFTQMPFIQYNTDFSSMFSSLGWSSVSQEAISVPIATAMMAAGLKTVTPFSTGSVFDKTDGVSSVKNFSGESANYGSYAGHVYELMKAFPQFRNSSLPSSYNLTHFQLDNLKANPRFGSILPVSTSYNGYGEQSFGQNTAVSTLTKQVYGLPLLKLLIDNVNEMVNLRTGMVLILNAGKIDEDKNTRAAVVVNGYSGGNLILRDIYGRQFHMKMTLAGMVHPDQDGGKVCQLSGAKNSLYGYDIPAIEIASGMSVKAYSKTYSKDCQSFASVRTCKDGVLTGGSSDGTYAGCAIKATLGNRGVLYSKIYDSKNVEVAEGGNFFSKWVPVGLLTARPWSAPSNLEDYRKSTEYRNLLASLNYNAAGASLSDDSRACTAATAGQISINGRNFNFKPITGGDGNITSGSMACRSLYMGNGNYYNFTGTFKYKCQDGVVSILENKCGKLAMLDGYTSEKCSIANGQGVLAYNIDSSGVFVENNTSCLALSCNTGFVRQNSSCVDPTVIVKQVFQSLFGRDPSTDEMNLWYPQVLAKNIRSDDLTNSLKDWMVINKNAIVRQAYFNIFGDTPSKNTIDTYAAQVEKNRKTYADIKAIFLGQFKNNLTDDVAKKLVRNAYIAVSGGYDLSNFLSSTKYSSLISEVKTNKSSFEQVKASILTWMNSNSKMTDALIKSAAIKASLSVFGRYPSESDFSLATDEIKNKSGDYLSLVGRFSTNLFADDVKMTTAVRYAFQYVLGTDPSSSQLAQYKKIMKDQNFTIRNLFGGLDLISVVKWDQFDNLVAKEKTRVLGRAVSMAFGTNYVFLNLKNEGTSLCLQSDLKQGECQGNRYAQAWQVASTTNGGLHILNIDRDSGGVFKAQSLVKNSGNTVRMVPSQLSESGFFSAPRWRLLDFGGGRKQYREIQSGLCLEAKGSQEVSLGTCTSGKNQIWIDTYASENILAQDQALLPVNYSSGITDYVYAEHLNVFRYYLTVNEPLRYVISARSSLRILADIAGLSDSLNKELYNPPTHNTRPSLLDFMSGQSLMTNAPDSMKTQSSDQYLNYYSGLMNDATKRTDGVKRIFLSAYGRNPTAAESTTASARLGSLGNNLAALYAEMIKSISTGQSPNALRTMALQDVLGYVPQNLSCDIAPDGINNFDFAEARRQVLAKCGTYLNSYKSLTLAFRNVLGRDPDDRDLNGAYGSDVRFYKTYSENIAGLLMPKYFGSNANEKRRLFQQAYYKVNGVYPNIQSTENFAASPNFEKYEDLLARLKLGLGNYSAEKILRIKQRAYLAATGWNMPDNPNIPWLTNPNAKLAFYEVYARLTVENITREAFFDSYGENREVEQSNFLSGEMISSAVADRTDFEKYGYKNPQLYDGGVQGFERFYYGIVGLRQDSLYKKIVDYSRNLIQSSGTDAKRILTNAYGNILNTSPDTGSDLYKNTLARISSDRLIYADLVIPFRTELNTRISSHSSAISYLNPIFANQMGRPMDSIKEYWLGFDPAVSSGGEIQLLSLNSGKCLDIEGGPNSFGDGRILQQFSCLGLAQTNQIWKLSPTPGGAYKIIAKHSGKCLWVGDSSSLRPDSHNTVTQKSCGTDSDASFQWDLVPRDKEGAFQIVSRYSGRCLDVEHWGRDNGQKVITWTCGYDSSKNAQGNQLWITKTNYGAALGSLDQNLLKIRLGYYDNANRSVASKNILSISLNFLDGSRSSSCWNLGYDMTSSSPGSRGIYEFNLDGSCGFRVRKKNVAGFSVCDKDQCYDVPFDGRSTEISMGVLKFSWKPDGLYRRIGLLVAKPYVSLGEANTAMICRSITDTNQSSTEIYGSCDGSSTPIPFKSIKGIYVETKNAIGELVSQRYIEYKQNENFYNLDADVRQLPIGQNLTAFDIASSLRAGIQTQNVGCDISKSISTTNRLLQSSLQFNNPISCKRDERLEILRRAYIAQTAAVGDKVSRLPKDLAKTEIYQKYSHLDYSSLRKKIGERLTSGNKKYCVAQSVLVEDGESVEMFKTSLSDNCADSTIKTTRKCVNGKFEGDSRFVYAVCSSKALDCNLDGHKIADGSEILLYSTSSAANCENKSMARKCTAGVLGGDPTYSQFSCENTGTSTVQRSIGSISLKDQIGNADSQLKKDGRNDIIQLLASNDVVVRTVDLGVIEAQSFVRVGAGLNITNLLFDISNYKDKRAQSMIVRFRQARGTEKANVENYVTVLGDTYGGSVFPFGYRTGGTAGVDYFEIQEPTANGKTSFSFEVPMTEMRFMANLTNQYKNVAKVVVSNASELLEASVAFRMIQRCVYRKSTNQQVICVADENTLYDDIGEKKTSLCPNGTYCVHENMSLFSQNSKEMLQFLKDIGKAAYYPTGEGQIDPFACVPTAGAMGVNAFVKDRGMNPGGSNAVFAKSFDFSNVNKKSASYADQSKMIWRTGQYLGYVPTAVRSNGEIAWGNTPVGNQPEKFGKLLNDLTGRSSWSTITNGSDYMSNRGPVDLFDNGKSYAWMMTKYHFIHRKPYYNFLVQHDSGGAKVGHMLAWAGFDSRNHLIFDPWYRQITSVKIDYANGRFYSMEGKGYLNWYRGEVYPLGVSGFSPQNANSLIESAGRGCDEGDCLWINGDGFSKSATVKTYTTTGQLLQSYSATDLNIVVKRFPHLITLRLKSDAEYSQMHSAGLKIQVNNGFGSTADYTIVPPAPVISNAGVGCDDGTCIWFTGANFTKRSYVATFRVASNGSWVRLGTYNASDLWLGELSKNPQAISFKMKSNDEIQLARAGNLVVQVGMGNLTASRFVNADTRDITGYIDGANFDSDKTLSIWGWACTQWVDKSIDVHLYVGGPAGSGSFVKSVTASLPSEEGVSTACNNKGRNYRFNFRLSQAEVNQWTAKRIYVHGISLNGRSNLLLNNSGKFYVKGFNCPEHHFYSPSQNKCIYVRNGIYDPAWTGTGGCWNSGFDIKVSRSFDWDQGKFNYSVDYSMRADYRVKSGTLNFKTGETSRVDYAYRRDYQTLELRSGGAIDSPIEVWANGCKSWTGDEKRMTINNDQFN